MKNCTQVSLNQNWKERVIRIDQIEKYKKNGATFIDDDHLQKILAKKQEVSASRVSQILEKSLAIASLTLEEVAVLMSVQEEALWDKMFIAAEKIKHTVYDNRIVTFAPLYLSNLCVNNCEYCGFKSENNAMKRKCLSMDDIVAETKVLAGKIGHKRLISVYGEHPLTDANYIVQSLQAIYSVKEKTKNGFGSIRRVNVNAAPMSIEDLKMLHEAGIGTFQVFQETYHRPTYEKVHPQNTIKGNYEWRLYCMHRAQEAGVDDVGIGSLFGLYDWRYEVLGLVQHAIELESTFKIGPHTVSAPRLQPASDSALSTHSKWIVNDSDYKKIITLLRLAIPYTGIIISARESPSMHRELYPIMTQRDASSNIKIGGYEEDFQQKSDKQQFLLGDERSLDEVIRELATLGYITSFCTAGYRCGRTGKKIMNLLRCGREGQFCKLNAIITYREWLDDFATEETKRIGEQVLLAEMNQVKEKVSESEYALLKKYYDKTVKGSRDLYF